MVKPIQAFNMGVDFGLETSGEAPNPEIKCTVVTVLFGLPSLQDSLRGRLAPSASARRSSPGLRVGTIFDLLARPPYRGAQVREKLIMMVTVTMVRTVSTVTIVTKLGTFDLGTYQRLLIPHLYYLARPNRQSVQASSSTSFHIGIQRVGASRALVCVGAHMRLPATQWHLSVIQRMQI